MLTKRTILLLTVFFPVILFGQNENFKQKWYKGWDIGAMGGGSYFVAEMKKDFSRVSMDMNTNPTASFNIHLDKTAKGKFGYGIEFGKNFFSGDKTFPTKINWLLYDTERFNTANSHFVVAPVYFKTNLTSFFLNMNYSFQNFRNRKQDYLNSNMYLKLGAGFSSIGVEMGYKDPQYYKESQLLNPLYEKGQGIQSIKDVYGSVHLGGGLNHYLSNRVSLSTELMFLFVSNNYMDGVQNIEVTFKPDGTPIPNKYNVFSLVVELKVGISFHYNWYRKYKVNAAWEQTQEDFQNEFYYGGGN